MELRPYQSECIDAVNWHLQNSTSNPLCVLSTAAGKTIIFSKLIHEWIEAYPKLRAIVLADRVELVKQAHEKLHRVWPQAPIGVYAASLKSRDASKRITMAQIQSIYSKAYDCPPFDVAIVDEAHMIPLKGEGRYRTFLRECKVANPAFRVIGFTATPFRLDGGHIARPDGILNDVCYETDIGQLIDDGYLCPLTNKSGDAEIDTSRVHTRSGDFVAGELEAAAMRPGMVDAAVDEMFARAADRKAWLIFCCGVAHAHAVSASLATRGIVAPVITGDTDSEERAQILRDFDAGNLRAVVNVNCLTTGLDVTRIDMIALMRPTKSASLYIQMVGRGFRLHPEKLDCLVLDFGENIRRHGPINRIRVKDKPPSDGTGKAPTKECPNCNEVLYATQMECEACGYQFPPRETEHAEKAESEVSIIERPQPIEMPVLAVFASSHCKHGSDKETLRVTYVGKGTQKLTEFICLEHDGYARKKAERWWFERFGETAPTTVADATRDMFLGEKIAAATILVRAIPDGKYMRITGVVLNTEHAVGAIAT